MKSAEQREILGTITVQRVKLRPREDWFAYALSTEFQPGAASKPEDTNDSIPEVKGYICAQGATKQEIEEFKQT